MLKSLSALNVVKMMVSVCQINGRGKKEQINFSELASQEHVFTKDKGFPHQNKSLQIKKYE